MSNSKALFSRPASAYYLILGSVIALSALGLVMVLSASSVLSIKLHGSAYTLAQRQLLFAAIGVVLMIIGTRLSVNVWRRLAWPALIVAFVLLDRTADGIATTTPALRALARFVTLPCRLRFSASSTIF